MGQKWQGRLSIGCKEGGSTMLEMLRLLLRIASLNLSLSLSLYKTKEKQQDGIKFPNFRRLPSSCFWFFFLQLNMGKNTVHTTILKIPGD